MVSAGGGACLPCDAADRTPASATKPTEPQVQGENAERPRLDPLVANFARMGSKVVLYYQLESKGQRLTVIYSWGLGPRHEPITRSRAGGIVGGALGAERAALEPLDHDHHIALVDSAREVPLTHAAAPVRLADRTVGVLPGSQRSRRTRRSRCGGSSPALDARAGLRQDPQHADREDQEPRRAACLAERLERRVFADARSVPALRSAVAEFAAGAGATGTARDAVALAVSEAVTNVVVHAYVGVPRGEIMVDAWVGADERLLVEVFDEGIGMRPRTDGPGLGLGLTLIAQMAN